jgi:hypothetical protein
LAAPGHEHELVLLSLQIGPRSANPARFDAACRAFTKALGARTCSGPGTCPRARGGATS